MTPREIAVEAAREISRLVLTSFEEDIAIIERAIERALRGQDGWFLPRKKVNDIQEKSINRQIDRCKRAHYTNLQIRINGEYEYEQADWIKHMQPLPPPPAKEQT